MSGSYAINGTPLTLQPTTGRWSPRQLLGVDGNGRGIYAPLRNFELTWDLVDQAAFDELRTYFDSLTITGSVIVDLPKWDADSYNFVSYTGCFLREPERSVYFAEHSTRITWLVTNIRT